MSTLIERLRNPVNVRRKTNETLALVAEAADEIERLTAERNVCGSGAGCLYKDATIDALREQVTEQALQHLAASTQLEDAMASAQTYAESARAMP